MTSNPRNVLVLGAGGNFSQILVPRLVREAFNVRAFDVRPLNYECPCLTGSVRDADSLRRASEGMEAIVHAAGLHDTLPRSTAHPEAYEDFWQTNVQATHLVYRVALEQGVKKIVFLSSVAYYKGGPGYVEEDWPASRPSHNYYDLSKVLSEEIALFYAAGHRIQSIVLRPGNFTGLPEPDFSFLGGRLRREDVAQAAYLSLAYEPEGCFEPFNVVAGNPFSRDDLPDLQTHPMDVLEKYYPGVNAFLEGRGIVWKGMNRITSARRAMDKLGYRPEFTFEAYLRGLGFAAA